MGTGNSVRGSFSTWNVQRLCSSLSCAVQESPTISNPRCLATLAATYFVVVWQWDVMLLPYKRAITALEVLLRSTTANGITDWASFQPHLTCFVVMQTTCLPPYFLVHTSKRPALRWTQCMQWILDTLSRLEQLTCTVMHLLATLLSFFGKLSVGGDDVQKLVGSSLLQHCPENILPWV